jgi:hypothetical protein
VGDFVLPRHLLVVYDGVPGPDGQNALHHWHRPILNPPHYQTILPPLHAHCGLPYLVLFSKVSSVVTVTSDFTDMYPDSFPVNIGLPYGSKYFPHSKTSYMVPILATFSPPIKTPSSISWHGFLTALVTSVHLSLWQA